MEKSFYYLVTLKDGTGVFQGVMGKIEEMSPFRDDLDGYVGVYVKSKINLEELLNTSPDVDYYTELESEV